MKLLCLTWYLFIGVCTFLKKWLKNRISNVSNWCWMSALESQCWCDAIWKCNVCENMIETLFTANVNGLFCEIRMTYPIQMFKWFSLCLVFLNANGTGTVLVLQIGITICCFFLCLVFGIEIFIYLVINTNFLWSTCQQT